MAEEPRAPTDAPVPSKQSPDRVRLDLARRYVTVAGTVDTMSDLVAYIIRRALEQQQIKLTPEQRAHFDAELRDIMASPMAAFVDEVSADFADMFTTEDLAAAMAFYDTPSGRRYVKASLATVLSVAMSAASHGAMGENLPPPADAIEAPRVEAAKRVAARMRERLPKEKAAQLEALGMSVDGFMDMVARGLAASLSVDDLVAADAWLGSPAAARLEGPSPERDRMLERATASMMQKFDMPRMIALMRSILTPPPPPT